MSDLYNPSNVPYGIPNADGVTTALSPGKWKVLTPAAAERCTIVIEGQAQFPREGVMIERPGIYGQAVDVAVPEDPNNAGFPAETRSECTVTAQIPTATTSRPRAGDYITLTTDSDRGAERWVVKTCTPITPNNNYWTASIVFVLDPSQ